MSMSWKSANFAPENKTQVHAKPFFRVEGKNANVLGKIALRTELLL